MTRPNLRAINSALRRSQQEHGRKKVELAIYPGARPHKDKPQDDPAVQLWAWGGNSGFRIVVVKLDSEDSPNKIAPFYRKALSSHGDVLDCSAGSPQASSRGRNLSRQIECDGDHPKPGELEFKAGTKDAQHFTVGLCAISGI